MEMLSMQAGDARSAEVRSGEAADVRTAEAADMSAAEASHVATTTKTSHVATTKTATVATASTASRLRCRYDQASGKQRTRQNQQHSSDHDTLLSLELIHAR
jgi:hypothetical protein